jgi:radical SAM superfamily enzyme YgiQ (UPF0313 family)
MIDIILVSMPLIDDNGPTPGIFFVKGAAQKAGFSAKARDLNMWMFKQQDIDRSKLENYYMIQSNLKDVSENDSAYQTSSDVFEKYIVEHILPYPAKYIGVSLFSVYNIVPGLIFCRLLRKHLPNCSIVLGGNGVEDTAPGAKDVGEHFLNNKLADFVVYGEGEDAIQCLLADKPHPSINSRETKVNIDNIDEIGFPDYSDFFEEFEEFKQKKDIRLPILGSRGCVRKCTFCNVPHIWPNFRFRSGENIAKEMIHNLELYNVSNYKFVDSLVNGSMYAFRDMCKTLATYNTANENKISWFGQFICRSRRQMPPSDFELMRDAGANSVAIGIESGSEKVRNDIRKGFTEEDMIYTIDQLLEKGIFVTLMFIVGYPTETDEDFEQNIKLLEKYAPHVDDMSLRIGKTLRLLDSTPLTTDFTHLYHYDDHKYPEWVSSVVPDLTFEKRVERAIRLRNVALELGYNIDNLQDDVNFFDYKLDLRKQN